MALATLIDDLYIDVVTRRSHSAPLSITTNTIENGTQLANHVARQVETLVLDVSMVDDKYAYFGSEDALVKASNRVTSRDDKKAALWQIKDDYRIIDVTMFDAHYPNFAIVDIQDNERTGSMGAYTATVVMQKIKTAETETRKVPLETIRKENDANRARAAAQQEPEKDGGQVAGEDAAKKLDSATIAAGIFDSFFGGG